MKVIVDSSARTVTIYDLDKGTSFTVSLETWSYAIAHPGMK